MCNGLVETPMENDAIAVARQPLARPRTVERLVAGEPGSDGAGVRLNRVLVQSLQQRLDPYLMLDAFGSDDPGDYIAGFPAHPHRGFETITYMIAGRMRHRDSAGNEGLLQNGGVQWMTAGRGVIHSEMPEQESGRMEGFQLWLNLPADRKMTQPWYRDIGDEQIPRVRLADGTVAKIVAGRSHGVDGAVQRDVTEPLYLDVHLPRDGRFEQPLPPTHNAFVYSYRGEVSVGGTKVPESRMAILANRDDADGVEIVASGPARVLLIAGRPLNEPIVQYGPFVMNSREQVFQAVRDFQEGRFAA
jgi:quercetin 2,3-dioxygenase